jgi:hypothetical protein
MRLPPLGRHPLMVRLGQLQRRAIIDRRLAERPRPGPLAIEFVFGLVGGIKPAGSNQPVARRVVDREAILLAHHDIRHDAEPCEVGVNARSRLLGRTLAIGVVEPQHIGAAGPLGE